MNKTEIMTKLSRSFNKTGLTLKKHSPEILVIAGVVGTVVSAVMACKATTKASAVLEEAKTELDLIHGCNNNPEMAQKYLEKTGEEYTPETYKKDLTLTYVQTGVKFAKLYAPAVILGALSITSILASNNILRKRNVALAAAYATVDKSFKEYRSRVVDRFGEAVDRELKYNIKAKKIEETVVDEKTGEEKTVKKTVSVIGREGGYGPYADFFDESCEAWEKNAEYNLLFVRAQQQYANDLLRSKGYLFLNEVRAMLGMKPVKEGQIVGWLYCPEDKDRDCYVDFGILETYREAIKDSKQAYERTLLLDFNPDGDIWSLMNTEKYYHKFIK